MTFGEWDMMLQSKSRLRSTTLPRLALSTMLMCCFVVVAACGRDAEPKVSRPPSDLAEHSQASEIQSAALQTNSIDEPHSRDSAEAAGVARDGPASGVRPENQRDSDSARATSTDASTHPSPQSHQSQPSSRAAAAELDSNTQSKPAAAQSVSDIQQPTAQRKSQSQAKEMDEPDYASRASVPPVTDPDDAAEEAAEDAAHVNGHGDLDEQEAAVSSQPSIAFVQVEADAAITVGADPEVTGPRTREPIVIVVDEDEDPQTGKSGSGRNLESAQGAEYVYFDGPNRRTVTIQTDLAMVTTSSAQGQTRSLVRRSEVALGAVTEPVFRSDTGQVMTLPGGVLIKFEDSWSQGQISQFFSRNGITPDRYVEESYAPNAYFIETAAGLPSLELANLLAAQDGVVYSLPNWQAEATTR